MYSATDIFLSFLVIRPNVLIKLTFIFISNLTVSVISLSVSGPIVFLSVIRLEFLFSLSVIRPIIFLSIIRKIVSFTYQQLDRHSFFYN